MAVVHWADQKRAWFLQVQNCSTDVVLACCMPGVEEVCLACGLHCGPTAIVVGPCARQCACGELWLGRAACLPRVCLPWCCLLSVRILQLAGDDVAHA